MSFTQGGALPNITTTQSASTVAPAFYTSYLSNLVNQGQQAAGEAQYVGATPLQQAAFNQVGANVGNYQPALAAADKTAAGVAGACIAQQAQNYMSPYIKCVVNSIGTLGEQNIAQNIAPQTTAGIVGAGQFGSSRGVGALGQTLANAGNAITGMQACALEKGYGQALCTAKAQNAQQLQASQQLGNLANTTQSLGLGDVNALATLGAQCQTIQQNAQLFPMQQLMNESQLLRGYTIPTTTNSSYTGPIPGAYAPSALQQVAGLGALAAGISCTNLGKVIGQGACSLMKYLTSSGCNFGCAGVSSASCYSPVKYADCIIQNPGDFALGI
jgi:hypothetical protein